MTDKVRGQGHVMRGSQELPGHWKEPPCGCPCEIWIVGEAEIQGMKGNSTKVPKNNHCRKEQSSRRKKGYTTPSSSGNSTVE